MLPSLAASEGAAAFAPAKNKQKNTAYFSQIRASKVTLCCVVSAVLVCFAGAIRAQVTGAVSNPSTVIAIASDVQSVVLRESSGQLRRYAKDALLGGGQWRVNSVESNKVVLQALGSLHGRPLHIVLKVGDQIDLDATASMANALQTLPDVPSTSNAQATNVPRQR